MAVPNTNRTEGVSSSAPSDANRWMVVARPASDNEGAPFYRINAHGQIVTSIDWSSPTQITPWSGTWMEAQAFADTLTIDRFKHDIWVCAVGEQVICLAWSEYPGAEGGTLMWPTALAPVIDLYNRAGWKDC